MWRRFRELPLATQVLSWLAAGVLAVAAVGSATGGKEPSRSGGRAATSDAAPRVTHSSSSSVRLATTTTATARATPTTEKRTTKKRSTSTTAQVKPTTAQRAASTAIPSPSAHAAGRCRGGNPLADVYHPYRLLIKDACMTVIGTVASVRHEDDGDVHLNLVLQPGESRLLDQANYSHEDGELVTEIVPADQPGCVPGQPPPLPPTAYRSVSYSYGRCTGADVATPPLGSEVSVTGPYVLDSDHGWMELHPVWAVTVISRPVAPSAPVQSSPAAPETVPAQLAGGSSSAWCKASATPSNDGYAGDYQVSVQSDQPDARATASDSGDTWSDSTDSGGAADIRLYRTAPGMTITVTVGAASCSTTA